MKRVVHQTAFCIFFWKQFSGSSLNVGKGKVVAFEQQRFSGNLRQRIGKTVTEVQSGGMAVTFAVDSEGCKGGSSLLFGNRNDRKPQCDDEVFKEFLAFT